MGEVRGDQGDAGPPLFTGPLPPVPPPPVPSRASIALRIEPSRLLVDPGAQGSATLTIRNASQLVQAYRVVPRGPAGEWCSIALPERGPDDDRSLVYAFPDHEVAVTVVVSPPRTPPPLAGLVTLILDVVSVVDDAVVSGEIVVDVLPVGALTSDLTPVTARGSRRATFSLALTNDGNTATTVIVEARSVGDGLSVPPLQTVELRPSKTVDLPLRVEVLSTFLLGPSIRHDITVTVKGEGGMALPVVLSAVFYQRPRLRLPSSLHSGRRRAEQALDGPQWTTLADAGTFRLLSDQPIDPRGWFSPRERGRRRSPSGSRAAGGWARAVS
jgi:hypothetical protein